MNAPVHCGQCGALLDERPGTPVENRTPCSCGSTTRQYSQSLSSEIKSRASVKARQKRPGISGYLVEMFVGKQPRKALGGVIIGWVDKFWRKDKSADRYIEHVVTEEGEVLKDVDEPLSAHRDHGSDKPELKAERLKVKGK
jgi:hypothetical protein